jgi:hypothetical protein
MWDKSVSRWWPCIVPSSGMWHRSIEQQFTEASEEHCATVFRIVRQVTKNTESRTLVLLFYPESEGVYFSEMTTNRYQNTRCHIPEDNHACCIKNSRFLKPNLYKETFPSRSQAQMYKGFGLHFLHVTSGIPPQFGLLKCSYFSQWRFSIFIAPYILNLVWSWWIFATEWIWLGRVTR